jgi:hypothetical protein
MDGFLFPFLVHTVRTVRTIRAASAAFTPVSAPPITVLVGPVLGEPQIGKDVGDPHFGVAMPLLRRANLSSG